MMVIDDNVFSVLKSAKATLPMIYCISDFSDLLLMLHLSLHYHAPKLWKSKYLLDEIQILNVW